MVLDEKRLLEWKVAGIEDSRVDTHEKHRDGLHKQGFRSPSPQEVISLILDYHERRVSHGLEKIAERFLQPHYPILMNTAVQRTGPIITFYNDIKHLVLDGPTQQHYTPIGFESTWAKSEKRFQLHTSYYIAELATLKKLNELNKDLLEFIFTRKLADIPQRFAEEKDSISGNESYSFFFKIPDKQGINPLIIRKDYFPGITIDNGYGGIVQPVRSLPVNR